VIEHKPETIAIADYVVDLSSAEIQTPAQPAGVLLLDEFG
jgi:hypothetical protein